jgi:phosphate starvation-inducible PhoH-like protein
VLLYNRFNKVKQREGVGMAERLLEVDCMDTALAIFGNCDENIRLLEAAFGITAICRGTQIKLTGDEDGVEKARKAVDAMLSLRENGTPLEEQTVRYCISLAGSGDEEKVKELTGDFVAITAKGRPVRPKTLGQKAYIAAIAKHSITFGVGPAGTGKTYLAVAMAVKAFKAHEVSRIILTRPAVEAGEKLGFLPGDLQNKVDPYLRPLYDALFDMLGAEKYQSLLEKQLIEVAPLAYMRGRTLDDAFIILDEAQNTSPEQMKMFLTRMGAGSKVVVTGDVTQIDLPDKARSGLVDALSVLRGIEGIAAIHFSEKDVVRHRLVQEIIKAYDKAGASRHKR